MHGSSFIHHTLTLLEGGLHGSRSLGIVPEYYILPFLLCFPEHYIVDVSALPFAPNHEAVIPLKPEPTGPSTFSLFF